MMERSDLILKKCQEAHSVIILISKLVEVGCPPESPDKKSKEIERMV